MAMVKETIRKEHVPKMTGSEALYTEMSIHSKMAYRMYQILTQELPNKKANGHTSFSRKPALPQNSLFLRIEKNINSRYDLIINLAQKFLNYINYA